MDKLQHTHAGLIKAIIQTNIKENFHKTNRTKTSYKKSDREMNEGYNKGKTLNIDKPVSYDTSKTLLLA